VHFTTYWQIEDQFKRYPNALLLTQRYDQAIIRDGEEFVCTFDNVEAVRFKKDGSLLYTLPNQRGIRWINELAYPTGIFGTRLLLWRGGLETHTALKRPKLDLAIPSDATNYQRYKLIRQVGNYDEIRTTKTFLYHPDGQRFEVPETSVPRRKTLTAEGKEMLDAGVRLLKERLEFHKAKHVLMTKPRDFLYMIRFDRSTIASIANRCKFGSSEEIDEYIKLWDFHAINVPHLTSLITRHKYVFAEAWNLPVTYEEV